MVASSENVAAPATLNVLLAVTAPVNVEAPVTPRVPAILVLPDEAATVNLLVFTSKSPSMPVAPEKASGLLCCILLHLKCSS